MKKNLLTELATYRFLLGTGTKALALASIFCLGLQSETKAQSEPWKVYTADVLPNALTENAFTTASVTIAAGQPSDSPVIVESENSIVANPDDPNGKVLRFKIESTPHQSFLWRQNFPTPTPPAATIVVRAKGMPGIERAFEIDLDFGGFRETVYIINPTEDGGNGKITFNVGRNADATLVNKDLGVNTREWHTYRFVKSGNNTKVYIDESATPAAESTVPAGGSASYFRIGDGSSGQANGSWIDFITWDATGAYTPAQKPLPENVLLAARHDLENAGALSVYPNPTTDRFAVTHSAARKGTTIAIYSANGVRVGTIEVEQGTTSTLVDLAAKKGGLYTIVYSEGTLRSSTRVIKQ